MHYRVLGVLICSLSATVCLDFPVSAASLEWLHPVSQAHLSSAVIRDVSADGQVMVGEAITGAGSTNCTVWAFRWERNTGFKKIGGGNYYASAYAVSGNGSVVAGEGGYQDVYAIRSLPPYYGIGALGSLAPHDDSGDTTHIYGSSYDGSVLVGAECTSFTSTAFKWTNSDKFVSLGSGTARDCSSDGSVIVGSSNDAPVYWDSQGVAHSMGSLAGVSSPGTATDVSGDGTIAVGYMVTDYAHGRALTTAFIRTTDQGMVNLGALPKEDFAATTTAVSDDGRVVVGDWRCSTSGFPGFVSGGFIWTPEHGMRDITDVLIQDYGLSLNGYRIDGCSGMSTDGRFMYGAGVNATGQPDLWVVDMAIPEPASLLALTTGFLGLGITVFKRRLR